MSEEALKLSTESIPANKTENLLRSLSSPRALPWWAVSATCFVYLNTLRFNFVFDDIGQIKENPHIRSWNYLGSYFTGNVWSQLYHQGNNYYRPLFLIWLRLNYVVFGLREWLWHAAAVGLHAVAAYLVFRLTKKLCGDDVLAFLAALIFGLHPSHIEAVAWVSGVTEPLVAIPVLASFLFFIDKRAAQQESKSVSRQSFFALGSFIFYCLALLAKETAILFPVIIFAYEWILSAPSSRPRFARLKSAAAQIAPYALLLAAYLVARSMALGAMRYNLVKLSISSVMLTVPRLVLFYIKSLFFPFNLSPFYSIPYVKSVGLHNVVAPLAAILLLGLILILWIRSLEGNDRAVAKLMLLWTAVFIAPVLNVSVLLVDDFAHDRYVYLPSVGFCILAAMAVKRLSFGKRKAFGVPLLRLGVLVLVCGSFAVGTALQANMWANGLALFGRALAVTPDNRLARLNFALEMAQRYDYPQAISRLEQLAKDCPDFWLGAYDLAYGYYKTGRLTDAQREFQQAIPLFPDNPDQFMYLGLTYYKMGNVAEAVRLIRHAIDLNQEGEAYHFALGMVFEQQGNYALARAEYEAELRNNPNMEMARQRLKVLDRQGPAPSP